MCEMVGEVAEVVRGFVWKVVCEVVCKESYM
jgi:hypothetical protein